MQSGLAYVTDAHAAIRKPLSKVCSLESLAQERTRCCDEIGKQLASRGFHSRVFFQRYRAVWKDLDVSLPGL